MKKLYTLFLSVLLYTTITAQITVAGGCIGSSATLTQGTNPSTRNGKVYYEGSGTVNTIDDGPVLVAISIIWDSTANEWRLQYDGQPYFTSTANTSQPPGTASTVFSWETAETAPCGSPGALSVEGSVALWVTFGSIEAYTKENSLRVTWTTEKEVNNDHFDIEASTDGEQFIAIGNLKSKAENGNSDITLNYEWTGNASMSLAVLPYLAFVLILLIFIRRKKTVLLATVAVSFIAFAQISCKKDKDSITDDDKYYIRIAQIDKDGTKTYSKVVRVNGE